MPSHASESPAKKQSKWSPEEDALIIELRGSGMKWEDISKRLPGRSAISCRLHYQNYLERRSEWDEERKTKLARLYDRLKPEMWAKVAEEMAVPWRAAEAMHWQLGEQEMARRAGVVPFSLTATTGENFQQPQQPSVVTRPQPRGHAHSRSQGSIFRDSIVDQSRSYGRSMPTMTPSGPRAGRPLGVGPSRKEGPPPPLSHLPTHLEHVVEPAPMSAYSHSGGGGPLAPIQTQIQTRPGMLPGLAELTTGISPYSTPAWSAAAPSASPIHSATASPGPFLPAIGGGGGGFLESAGGVSSLSKRRRSPELMGSSAMGDPSRRRPQHLDPRSLDPLDRSIPRHMP